MLLNKDSHVVDFPLQDKVAKAIVKNLATNQSAKIRISTHAKERMQQRGVTIRQIFHILKDDASRLTEKPHLTAGRSWKFNLLGVSAGERIEVVVDLKNCETDPDAYIVTVILK